MLVNKRTTNYGTHDDETMDIYSSENISPESNTSNHVIIWVHGGLLVLGDKEQFIDDKVEFFTAQHGITLVSINYPLLPEARLIEQLASVQDAVTAVTAELAAESISIIGHSSGGLLASQAFNESFLSGRVLLDPLGVLPRGDDITPALIVVPESRWVSPLITRYIQDENAELVRLPLDHQALNRELGVDDDYSNLILNWFGLGEVTE